MISALHSLDRLVPPLRERVQRLADALPAEVRQSLRGWTLFGVAVRPEFDPLRHRATSVLVWDAVDLPVLRSLAQHQPHWDDMAFATPLVMTPTFLAESRDSFPLELIEIQQQRVTIWGNDRFHDLTFRDADIRLQAERELKSMLVAMRQGLLISTGDQRAINAALDRAADGILRVLRGLLWLRGQRQPHPAAVVVEGIEQLIHRRLGGIRRTLTAGTARGWDAFVELYDDLLALSRSSDAW